MNKHSEAAKEVKIDTNSKSNGLTCTGRNFRYTKLH